MKLSPEWDLYCIVGVCIIGALVLFIGIVIFIAVCIGGI